MTPEDEQFKAALTAVYQKTPDQGYQRGFAAAMNEAWLSKFWPQFTLPLGLFAMGAALWLGWAMP